MSSVPCRTPPLPTTLDWAAAQGWGCSHSCWSPHLAAAWLLGLCPCPPLQLCFNDLEELLLGTVECVLGTLLQHLLCLQALSLRPGAFLQPHLPVPGFQNLLPLGLPLEHLGQRGAEGSRGPPRAGSTKGLAAQASSCSPPEAPRTALARFFSFLCRVQSPEEISSRVMVPSFEPQPTTQPLSCKRRLERGSSQIWGGRMGGCHFLALTWCPPGSQAG